MGATEGLRDLAAPALALEGLELWDVEMLRGVLRITVDRAGGVDLDGLGAATRALSPLLDEHPELTPQGAYQLEVSSPGVERRLRSADHFRRYLGRELAVKTTRDSGAPRRLRGMLESAGERSVTLVAGDPPAAHELRYEQIERAVTVADWTVATPTTTKDARQ